MIFYCIRMLQLREWLIRQCSKQNCPFVRSSGPCLQNIIHDNVAVNGGGREFYTPWRDSGAENE